MLALCSAMLKFGPARNAFEAAAKLHLSADRGPLLSTALSPKVLYTILVETVVNLDQLEMPHWVRHCGSMGHVLGFLPWLSRLGILSSSRTAGQSLSLGEGHGNRWVCPWSDRVGNRLGRVLEAHDVALSCQHRPSEAQCPSSERFFNNI